MILSEFWNDSLVPTSHLDPWCPHETTSDQEKDWGPRGSVHERLVERNASRCFRVSPGYGSEHAQNQPLRTPVRSAHLAGRPAPGRPGHGENPGRVWGDRKAQTPRGAAGEELRAPETPPHAQPSNTPRKGGPGDARGCGHPRSEQKQAPLKTTVTASLSGDPAALGERRGPGDGGAVGVLGAAGLGSPGGGARENPWQGQPGAGSGRLLPAPPDWPVTLARVTRCTTAFMAAAAASGAAPGGFRPRGLRGRRGGRRPLPGIPGSAPQWHCTEVFLNIVITEYLLQQNSNQNEKYRYVHIKWYHLHNFKYLSFADLVWESILNCLF